MNDEDKSRYEAYLKRAKAKGVMPISLELFNLAWQKHKYYINRIESANWLTPEEMADDDRICKNVLLFDPTKKIRITFDGVPIGSFREQWGPFDLSKFEYSGKCKPAPPQPPKSKSTFFDSESFNKAFTYVEADENGMIECPHCGLHFHYSEWHFCYNHTE